MRRGRTQVRSRPRKALTDTYGAVDIRAWQRGGQLVPGTIFALLWLAGVDTQRIAEVRVTVHETHVEIAVGVMFADADVFAMNFMVYLDYTSARFGGRRAWFRCPESDCGQRAAILYWHEADFKCRRCAGHAYRSQRQSPTQRARARLIRLYERLGGEPNADGTERLRRPRGMHTATWCHLQAEIVEAERDYIKKASDEAAALQKRAEHIRAKVQRLSAHATALLED